MPNSAFRPCTIDRMAGGRKSSRLLIGYTNLFSTSCWKMTTNCSLRSSRQLRHRQQAAESRAQLRHVLEQKQGAAQARIYLEDLCLSVGGYLVVDGAEAVVIQRYQDLFDGG